MRFQVMNLRQIMIITVVIFILSISCDRIDSFATAQGRTWSILPSKLKHTNIIRTSKNKNDNENDKKKYNNHHHIRSEDNNDVDSQMMYISFFAFLHQASMPLADLIDGAFLSDMDASSLGAMGVARSCQVRTVHRGKDPFCPFLFFSLLIFEEKQGNIPYIFFF